MSASEREVEEAYRRFSNSVNPSNTTSSVDAIFRGDTIPTPQRAFRVGDRVRCIKEVLTDSNLDNLKVGMVGVIKRREGGIRDLSIGVDWGMGFKGHNLNIDMRDTGLWVRREDISLITTRSRTQRIPDITTTRLNELNQAQEYKFITSDCKHTTINKEREKLYLKYFTKLKGKVLNIIKIVKPPIFKLGECVKGDTVSGITFDEGTIISKLKGNYKVLVYKKSGKFLNEGYIDNCSYKNLIRIKKTISLKFVRTKRLFEPKRIMTIKTDIKNLVKTIKKLDSVKECRLVKGKDYKDKAIHNLYVTTKDLIFVDNRRKPYKKRGQKYNFGKYELKIIIPPIKYIYKHEGNRIRIGYYITAKRVKGTIKMLSGDSKGVFSFNPYTSASMCNFKDFRYICFGAGHSFISKTYQARDYYTLVELVISNLVSISDEGYVRLNSFLEALEKEKK